MIKTGIYDIRQIRRGSVGSKKRISVTLYDQIANEHNSGELAETILSSFVDERGAYKRTHTNRFEEFDVELIKLLENIFSKSTEFIIHDVAVSDGRTSCDLFKKLAQHFAISLFTASDYSPKVRVLERGKVKVTLSDSGKVLEVVWPPLVFNPAKNDSMLRYPINRLVRPFINHFVVKPMLRSNPPVDINTRDLWLFAPKAISLATKDKRFHLTQHNILDAFESPSHIIRAMNVLNPSRFTPQEFKILIGHLWDGLLEGGLLVVGSNHSTGAIVHGGIFRKTLNGFESILCSGDGSALEPQILEFKQ